MKIAFVTHSLSSAGGGVATVVEALSGALLDRGKLDLRVFGLADDRWTGEAASWRGGPAQGFPTFGPAAVGYAPGLARALTDFNPDLVHTHGIWMHPSAVVAGWSQRTKPYIVSPHGMLDSQALKISNWKKRIARRLYEDNHLVGAHFIHALNAAEAKHIRQFGLRNPIAIIPNGVALPEPKQKQLSAPWQELFQENSPILLFLGRIHPKKNLFGLIRAISELKRTKQLGAWKLAVVGWGNETHTEETKKLVGELGLHDEVSFLGPLFGSEKDAALRHASAFILPSFSEGLPMAVLEAWAYGLPVAMTSACNLPAGFDCGAAIQISTSPEEMVGPLADFLRMKSSNLRAMGHVGRDLVKQEFSWEAVAASFVDLYNWTSGKGSRPNFVFEANDAIG